ncbi:unnamed protein product [Polarella glacialis]|uniref:Uncharacterized protein n=1 Tax=Polarella glacialis TaxID=89957 RepID=A0A813EAU4_POLGL|nr:unnamed protein product [Polarella glacialis]
MEISVLMTVESVELSNVEAGFLDYRFLRMRATAFGSFPHVRVQVHPPSLTAAATYTIRAFRGAKAFRLIAKHLLLREKAQDLVSAVAANALRAPNVGSMQRLGLREADELDEAEEVFLEEYPSVRFARQAMTPGIACSRRSRFLGDRFGAGTGRCYS